jgi:hypothetical protein
VIVISSIKVECLFQASLSILVKCLWVRPRALLGQAQALVDLYGEQIKQIDNDPLGTNVIKLFTDVIYE